MARPRENGKPVREERDGFRLRPRGKKARGDRPPDQIAKTLSRLMRAVAGGNSRRAARRTPERSVRAQSSFRQRCAVRLTYSANRVPGHFAAHARYLLRDKAAGSEIVTGSIGATPLNEAMGQWQAAGDKRVFKVILSPEFGDRIDLSRLSREFIMRMESDLGVKLEWAAVNHFNTDHPHVHLVIRGVDGSGDELRLPAEYIKDGLRLHAEALCTEQIGSRSIEDVQHAQQREVQLNRFTSLDRLLLKRAELCPEDAGQLRVVLPDAGRAVGRTDATPELLAARLRFLSDACIAQAEDANRWIVPIDLEAMLRTMQNVADRQRMLARTGVAVSDHRLPQRITQPNEITQLRGRVLGHVDNDVTGRVYLVLEGTDAAIHFIPHNGPIEHQRAEGRLAPGHFAQFDRNTKGLKIDDLGNADDLVKGRKDFPALSNEIPALTEGWGGWLGSFHSRLRTPPRPQAPVGLAQVISTPERPDFER